MSKNNNILVTGGTGFIGRSLVIRLIKNGLHPIVFDNNLAPTDGPGLIFLTLPLAFSDITGGILFGSLFFILLGFAAITSAISLLEPSVAWMIETQNIKRTTSAIIIGSVIWLLGFLTILSFNDLSDFTFWKGTVFDNFDYLASNILLPISGLLFTIFASWFMTKSSSRLELSDVSPTTYAIWKFLARVIAPIGVIIIFLNAINIV